MEWPSLKKTSAASGAKVHHASCRRMCLMRQLYCCSVRLPVRQSSCLFFRVSARVGGHIQGGRQTLVDGQS